MAALEGKANQFGEEIGVVNCARDVLEADFTGLDPTLQGEPGYVDVAGSWSGAVVICHVDGCNVVYVDVRWLKLMET